MTRLSCEPLPLATSAPPYTVLRFLMCSRASCPPRTDRDRVSSFCETSCIPSVPLSDHHSALKRLFVRLYPGPREGSSNPRQNGSWQIVMCASKADFVYVPDFVLKSGFLVESREKLPPKDLPNPCKKPSSVLLRLMVPVPLLPQIVT